jgi:hypothetical protein
MEMSLRMPALAMTEARPSIGTRLRVWRHRDELDRRLARGDRPSGDLAIRAEQLTRPNCRHRVAAELEAALCLGELPCHERAISQVDIRQEVLRVRGDVETVIARLRRRDPVRPGGVALCLWLLRDHRSPLYEPSPEDELGKALHWALAALD